jgi:hypothetical protein
VDRREGTGSCKPTLQVADGSTGAMHYTLAGVEKLIG